MPITQGEVGRDGDR